ncbi:MAG: DUF2269 domain-containing protein [Gemmatimonadaceae bacterium]|nr:DUF2269 domain-containing protein [Gemmatimonadaceae bacterium]
MLDALLKSLHVIAATLFLGNVVVTGIWAALVFRARTRAADFAVAARAIWVTDILFSMITPTVLVVTGVVQAQRRALPLLGTPWIRDSILLLVGGTLLWLVILIPAQVQLGQAAAADDDAALRRAYRRWTVVGWLATVPLVLSVWRMVAKS